jgi:O-antigen/teichoic acid export membrane protein
MSSIRRNFVANILGKGFAALVTLGFVPVYVHFLGIEAYGLIGFYLAIYSIMTLFDLGLGTALNRELAKLAVQSGVNQRMRDLLRTLEVIYWTIGILIGFAVAGLAPVIAEYWIKPQSLTVEVVENALVLMGIAIACQWPVALYTGGLVGLQRQELQNTVAISMLTIRSAGAAAILWKVSATIEAFLIWQIFSSLMEAFITAAALWRSLPPASRARFRFDLLAESWRFAAGVMGISALGVLVSQLDKIILSNVLSLEMFGYYALANRVASGLHFVTNPVIASIFPRFSQLSMHGDEIELGGLYHKACQMMAILIMPLACALALFSFEFLLLWTRNQVLADSSHLVLSFLVVGNAFFAIASPPQALQLASGWTRLSIAANFSAVILMAPIVYLASRNYGAEGAAVVWALFAAVYLLALQHLMHRRLLRNDLRRWYFRDFLPPLAAVISVGALGKFLGPATESPSISLLTIILIFIAMLSAAIISAPEIRAVGLNWFRPVSH